MPSEIVSMARQRGLAGLAFADHMDMDAAAEGLRLTGGTGMRFFTGVEISTAWTGKEHHLVLYGFRPDDAVLRGFLRDSCRAIWDRADDALKVFTRMGFDIGREDIAGWGASVPTGVTLLDALLRRNRGDARLREYLEGPKASSPYLNFYQDYAVDDIGRIVLSALPGLVETMRSFRHAGILVLAHPGDADGEALAHLRDEGLMGVEAYSTHHSISQAERLVAIARSLGLWVSAGSDFHGELVKPGIKVGDCSGQPDDGLIEALSGLAG